MMATRHEARFRNRMLSIPSIGYDVVVRLRRRLKSISAFRGKLGHNHSSLCEALLGCREESCPIFCCPVALKVATSSKHLDHHPASRASRCSVCSPHSGRPRKRGWVCGIENRRENLKGSRSGATQVVTHEYLLLCRFPHIMCCGVICICRGACGHFAPWSS